MAQQYPAGVRRVHDEGHTVATHSQNHPLNFNRMPLEQAQREIDDGIAAVRAALADPSQLAPFFRIPGLRRAGSVEDYLASKGIMTWSADFPADDWRSISGAQVAELALSRLAAKGKGILLLHDIQQRTVDALPIILRELKARGYRIVHVIPADAKHPKTPTEPAQWRLRPQGTPVARTRWPKPPRFVFAAEGSFPVPGITDAELHDDRFLALPLAGARKQASGVARTWPRASAPGVSPATVLPIPALNVFSIEEHATGSVRRARDLTQLAGPPVRRANRAQNRPAPKPVQATATGRSAAAGLGATGVIGSN
jgi:hypothetical protein